MMPEEQERCRIARTNKTRTTFSVTLDLWWPDLVECTEGVQMTELPELAGRRKLGIGLTHSQELSPGEH